MMRVLKPLTVSELAELLRYKKPKARKKPSHQEDNLQIECVRWVDFMHEELSPLLFHPKNGGKSNQIEGARFKRMGVRKGVPDLILLVANKEFNALCLELKSDKGRQSQSQKEWQKVAEKNKIKYMVIKSLQEFINEINNYLKIK